MWIFFFLLVFFSFGLRLAAPNSNSGEGKGFAWKNLRLISLQSSSSTLSVTPSTFLLGAHPVCVLRSLRTAWAWQGCRLWPCGITTGFWSRSDRPMFLHLPSCKVNGSPILPARGSKTADARACHFVGASLGELQVFSSHGGGRGGCLCQGKILFPPLNIFCGHP